jgi:hypothetical protein
VDAGLPCPATTSGGTDRASAGKRAWELLKKPEIRDQIREFRRRAIEANQLDANAVLEALKHEATFPRTSVFDRRGAVRPPHLWPPEVNAFVAGFEVEETFPLLRDADGLPQRDEHGKLVRTVRRVYKVRFQKSTQAKRILAEWFGLIGSREFAVVDAPPLTQIILRGGERVDELRKQVFGDVDPPAGADDPARLTAPTD